MKRHAFRNLFAAGATLFLALACSSQPSEPDVGDLTDIIEPFDIGAYNELRPEPEIRSIDRRIDTGFDEREKLPRDAIVPIYSPRYVGIDEAQLINEELVLGVDINGEAKAMPVGLLRFREMVNDEVGGVPILATW